MKSISIKENVRLRPAMYVGATGEKGVYTMLESFLLDMIASSEMEEVEIQLNPKGAIRITSSGIDVKSFVKKLDILGKGYDPTNNEVLYKVLDLSVIICLSDSVKIEVYNGGSTHILTGENGDFDLKVEGLYLKEDLIMEFTPDKNIFQTTDFNFEKLNTIYERIAYINPEITIISADDSHDEFQRRVFHYPKGLGDKLDRLIEERTVEEPAIRLNIEKPQGNYHYTVSFCFLDRSDCSYIQSFAGFVDTLYHGSLVNGAMQGIKQALETFAARRGVSVEISEKQIKDSGLLLFAAVLGPDYQFAGSLKLELDMPEVEEGAKDVVCSELSQYLKENEEVGLSFVKRFTK